MDLVINTLASIEDTFEGIYRPDSEVFAEVDLGTHAKSLGYQEQAEAYMGVKIFIPVDLREEMGIQCSLCEFKDYSLVHFSGKPALKSGESRNENYSKMIIPDSLCMLLGEDICESLNYSKIIKYVMQ